MSLRLKKLIPLTIASIPFAAHALPIDWHGSFGVDSTMITDYRRVDNKTVNNTGAGSQEVGLAAGNKASASFQSYIFKLAPEIIVNDAATLKSEITTGYANGGFLGDSPSTSKKSEATSGNGDVGKYYYNQAKGTNLNVKKAYLELHPDTATWLVGRHSVETWGLGAMFSDGKDEFGNDTWNRFAYSRDGVTVKFKFNNFYISPFWAQSSNTGLTRSTDAKEVGSSFLYDNKEKEIAFGLYYSKKSDNYFNDFYKSDVSGTTVSQGDTNVKVTDIYLKKILGKFNFAVEVPLQSGTLGYVSSSSTISTISAKAVLAQLNYNHNDSWTFGIDAGSVSGHTGDATKFGATYLNPNFQIANLLFKYNMNAFDSTNTTASVFDGYITNAQYLKLRADFNTERWNLNGAIIMAKAMEVAKAGTTSYNHTKNRIFTAQGNQSDKLGTELDLNARYKWNKEISISGSFGYLFTGDYFGYSDQASASNKVKNSMLLQANTLVTF